MDKSYRIHTNIISDTLLKVNMQQDFDFLEILSLKLRQKDAYRLHSSNYGVIIGRVLANDAFGIPNAKISIFIERDKNDTSDMEAIYPYSEVTSKDREGRRYNPSAGLHKTRRGHGPAGRAERNAEIYRRLGIRERAHGGQRQHLDGNDSRPA